MRTLAAVFAHPDDETFATGGALAKYAKTGTRVALYSATDGDAGRSSGIPIGSDVERDARPRVGIPRQRAPRGEGLVVRMREHRGEPAHHATVSCGGGRRVAR